MERTPESQVKNIGPGLSDISEQPSTAPYPREGVSDIPGDVAAELSSLDSELLKNESNSDNKDTDVEKNERLETIHRKIEAIKQLLAEIKLEIQAANQATAANTIPPTAPVTPTPPAVSAEPVVAPPSEATTAIEPITPPAPSAPPVEPPNTQPIVEPPIVAIEPVIVDASPLSKDPATPLSPSAPPTPISPDTPPSEPPTAPPSEPSEPASPDPEPEGPTPPAPPQPLYTPGYTPDIPTYAPSTPEFETDFRAEFLRLVNGIARRDQERAVERYGGFRPFGALSGFLRLIRLKGVAEKVEKVDQKISEGFVGRTIGKIRSWFDKVGHRNVINDEQLADEDSFEENMKNAGRFQKRPWWRKCLKIGAKVLGGFGAAGAMVMTGGVGAATALLWSGGLKEGYDGVLQSIEEMGWGKKRGAAELERQSELQSRIEALRERVMTNNPPITPEEWFNAVSGENGILAAERGLMDKEVENIAGERKGQLTRSLLSTGLTIGTGLFAGVPLGRLNYDHDDTAIANALREATGQGPSAQVMNETHRGFWNLLHGGQFGYEHNGVMSAVHDSLNGSTPSGAEYNQMTEIIDQLQKIGAGQWKLTDLAPYGQTAHELGGGLLAPELYKLASPIPYLLAELFRHGAKRPGDKAENYRNLGRTEHDPDVAYPDGVTPRYGEPGVAPAPGNWSESRTYRSYLEWMQHGPQMKPRVKKSNPDGTEQWVDIQPDGTEKPTDRNVEREKSVIQDYLNRHDRKYQREIDALASHIKPMSEKCRVAVNIPAYHEGGNIYTLLEKYTKQTDAEGNALDPELYEINIIVNRGEDKPDDNSLAEIARFIADHPEYRINALSKVFKKDLACVGIARKYVTDVALQRSIARSKQDGPLYIETEDADLTEVDPLVVHNLISKLDGEPQLDAVRGVQDRDVAHLKDNDLAFLDRRIWDFQELLMRDKDFRPDKDPNWNFMWNRVVTGGWNTAYTAEAYASIGGYSSGATQGEDMDIGLRISMIRGQQKNGIIVPNVDTIGQVTTRSNSSNRRFVAALAGQYSAYGGGNFENEEINKRIRDASDDELMAMIDEYKTINNSNKSRFEGVLTPMYGMIRTFRGRDVASADKVFSKAMGYLGFRKEDWHLESGQVKIDNVQNFADACASYRTLGPLKRREFVKARDLEVEPSRFVQELNNRHLNINQFENDLTDAQRQEIVDAIS